MNEKYKDMLRLPHPVSATHPRMSLQDRAAQFSPFAALTGYGDALKETARLTDHFVELDEDRKQEIDRQIGYLQQRKNGGAYNTLEGCVQKIDENSKSLRIQGTEILVDKIYQIDFIRATL